MSDRTKYIGGSDAPVVLGISPWRTPLQLWHDKTQPAMPENTDPDRAKVLERGKRMEPYVVDLLAREMDLAVLARNARYIDPEHAFLAAEIDAEALLDDRNERVNLEIKTVSPFKARDWGEQESDEIPVYYTAQAQHGLMVTGRALCIFGVLIGGDDFRIYRVERDDEIIAAMRQREVAFWREYVEALVPPPATNASDIERLFRRDAGTAIEASPELLIAVDELRALKAEQDAVEARMEGVKGSIKAAMRDAARLTLNGRDLVTWKSQSARRFDQCAFEAANPALFERYLKTTESRIFRLK
ncbi:MAG: YqaJ viral recombinase family protein [Ideonella sp.]|nr:YqaJ viral recombinase family protein [Ideonella sp.]